MATTPASKKAKGNRLERDIAASYRSSGLFPRAQRMPMSGAMSFHKGDIFKGELDEWVDECKNQERVQLWPWWEQAVTQCTGLEKPVLHISGNYRPILTVMSFEAFLQLRLEIKQLRELTAFTNNKEEM